ncbi:MAG: deoxyribodipyrimidine photo-lyase [Cyanobacteria bacterium P01_H01_bin.121]
MQRTIVWFRRDLRIADHAPLARAARRGVVIPVFILDAALLKHPETGSARVAFMLDCLKSLDADLRQRGSYLIVRSGDPVTVLPDLLQETAAEGIYAYLDFERIYGRVRDARLNRALDQTNFKIRWFEPLGAISELVPYPQYRDRWYRDMRTECIPTPQQITTPPELHRSPIPTLADLGLEADGKPIPPAGTTAARELLTDFLTNKVDRYYWQLSYPSAEATTGLSPHIKFGAISIRECYQTSQNALKQIASEKIQRTRKQLISRLRWGSGFAQRFRYLPQLELRSLYRVFDDDGWAFDEKLYQAWQDGQTGFPIVDAAARCLQATGGWQGLNFRSRAIYASFLSNLLGMDWRYGALHFMRHLIDGDCPIDHYQWAMQAGVTHCADKTWTRIYNPAQAAIDRCDPDGLFIKRWVPELADVAPEDLGAPPRINGYPAPILDYKIARRRRVKQLERQRQPFLGQVSVLPFLAQLPDDLQPFGADRYPSEIGWASLSSTKEFQASKHELFPAPLDLDQLDEAGARALRTWFVAHVNIQPHKGYQQRTKQSKRQRRKHKPSPFEQLAIPGL